MMPVEDLVEEERFETSHTACAAYLLYCGLDIVDLVWEDFTCTFFFDNTASLQEHFAAFVRGQARVEPQQYSNTFGQVTRRMREHPDNPRRR
jgi:hypothetical protein